jgi:alpha-L-fucosidase
MRNFLLTLLLGMILCHAGLAQNKNNSSEPITLSNKPEREEWLKDHGFGMFIHFGIDSQLGMVISHSLVGASKEYVKRYFGELPKSFNPSDFNAKRIAKLAKTAGMKYMVFTTKHHSGFCMWDTETTEFNIMNTPYGQDMVQQYVEAAREQGLDVGFYYSPEDFHFLDEHGITISRRQFKEAITPSLKQEYHQFIRDQISELFSNYGKIDLLFLDGDYEEPAKNTAWKLQPDVLVTRGALETPEQTIPGNTMEEAWETCMTLGTQWQFKPTNEKYKNGTRMIEILSEIRSKGGSLLLNVGPDPYGVIPDGQENVLREMGAWNFINREAMFDVRPWIVPNEKNIIFTRSENASTVYGIITNEEDWEHGARKQFTVRSIESTENTKVTVLGQNDRVLEYNPDVVPETRFKQKENSLVVSAVRAQRIYNNRKWPNPVVLKFTNVRPALDPPRIDTEEINEEEGYIKISVDDMGDREKLKLSYEYRPYAGFVEELYHDDWKTSKNIITIDKPGEYTINITERMQKTHQIRAVALHPKVNIYGSILRGQME